MNTTTKKSATPDTLFARFLQKKAKLPTEKQIHTWENDGGNVETSADHFEVINGTVCCTFSQKVRAYVNKYWRFFRMQWHSKHLNHQQQVNG